MTYLQQAMQQGEEGPDVQVEQPTVNADFEEVSP